MLPFATYNIPETLKRETPLSHKWLWIVTGPEVLPAQEDLLQKIISALKAGSADVLMIPIGPNESLSMSAIHQSNPQLIISFGIQPSAIGLWIDVPAHGIRFLEKGVFIQSATLKELDNSPLAKKQLWSAMQLFLEKNK